ncbi:hypothetical protein VHEMI00102 [[Torrubiella] hemipterigena]|uniref:DNA-directed RNA polymerase III subunit RPC9 n=1 Tax=[Torrubiella] hemipterigena TaxID=1531966 RepID=A0A0A1T0W6_9HYPO|nr:hypothetical protein VHEMI00102 [[Torrubiella] hemipterigena]
MKITEAQSAVLSNYEVYQHLVDQRDQYKKIKRRGPPNLETVVSELLQYMRSKPNPLSQKPITYNAECVSSLVQQLRPYDLSKGEVVMILNLRPSSVVALNTVLEDMSDRYTEEQQEEMVQIILEVLGEPESGAAGGQEEGDVSMADAA